MAAPSTQSTAAARGRARPLALVVNLVRGGLIGSAEVVPGISGGTIALLVGIYETVITSADNLVRAVVHAVTDPIRGRGLSRAKERFVAVSWAVVLPVAVGMLAMVVVGAAVLAPLVEHRPIPTYAFMLGLMVVSLLVPIRLVGGSWRPVEYLFGLVAMVATFVLTGLPNAGEVDPPLWLVLIVAAVAVCALVLPGVSGSYLLLAIGIYAPTLQAVNERDFGYLGIFILGAILGLSIFVRGLRWLLEHHHRITFVIATGVIAGSLRSLWPWQGDNRELQLPGESVGLAAVLFLGGAALVTGILLIERQRSASQQTQDASSAAEHRT